MTMQTRAGGFRVLVLEDSASDQEMIRRAIRGVLRDAQVDCVTTIASARHVLRHGHFNAILCDNSVPDGRGSEFARELACDPRFMDTPIAVISGLPSPFMWDKARQAGLKIIDKTDNPVGKLHDFARKSLRSPTRVAPYPKLSASGGRA